MTWRWPRIRPASLREAAFKLVERVRGDAAVTAMLNAIREDERPGVRFRAFRAVTAIGDHKVGVQALEAFGEPSFSPDVIKQELVAHLKSMKWDGRRLAFHSIKSPSALARFCFVWFVEIKGFQEDHKRLDDMAEDSGHLPGFPPGMTVGSEAKRVSPLVKAKL